MYVPYLLAAAFSSGRAIPSNCVKCYTSGFQGFHDNRNIKKNDIIYETKYERANIIKICL